MWGTKTPLERAYYKIEEQDYLTSMDGIIAYARSHTFEEFLKQFTVGMLGTLNGVKIYRLWWQNDKFVSIILAKSKREGLQEMYNNFTRTVKE